MYRKYGLGLLALGFLALMTVFSLAGQARTAAAAATGTNNYYFGFEQNLGGWSAVTSNVVGEEAILERETGDNGCPDMHGNSYAALKVVEVPPANPVPVDANPLPEGSWIVEAFPAKTYNQVSVQFAARNAAGCDGCHPMVYIGSTRPTLASQFQVDDLYLKDYWQNFKAEDSLVSNTGTLYVAIGWNGTDASMALDCISININNLGPEPVPFPNPVPNQ